MTDRIDELYEELTESLRRQVSGYNETLMGNRPCIDIVEKERGLVLRRSSYPNATTLTLVRENDPRTPVSFSYWRKASSTAAAKSDDKRFLSLRIVTHEVLRYECDGSVMTAEQAAAFLMEAFSRAEEQEETGEG